MRKFKLCFWHSFTTVVLTATFLVSSVHGQGIEQERAVIQRLMDELWLGGLQAQRQGENDWEAYARSNTVSAQAEWAYVLNRIKFRRFRDARALIDRVADNFPEDQDVLYAEAWLKLMVDQYDVALLDLHAMKQGFITKFDPNNSTDETLEFYSRLGRLIGFTETVGQSKVNAVNLDKTVSTITSLLNDADLGAFEDHRLQVQRQYADLVNQKNTKVAEQLKAMEQKNAQRLTEIRMASDDLDVRQDVITDQISQLRITANEEINVLRAEADPLERRLASIDRQLVASQNRLSRYLGQATLLNLVSVNQTVTVGFGFNNSRFLRRQIRDEEFRLFELRQDYDFLLGQVNSVRAQINNAERSFNSQLAIRNNQIKQIDIQRRRDARELKRLQNPRTKRTGFVRAIDGKIQHLPTYDPFPADVVRQRLLDGIK